jgi:hypothetical protein
MIERCDEINSDCSNHTTITNLGNGFYWVRGYGKTSLNPFMALDEEFPTFTTFDESCFLTLGDREYLNLDGMIYLVHDTENRYKQEHGLPPWGLNFERGVADYYYPELREYNIVPKTIFWPYYFNEESVRYLERIKPFLRGPEWGTVRGNGFDCRNAYAALNNGYQSCLVKKVIIGDYLFSFPHFSVGLVSNFAFGQEVVDQNFIDRILSFLRGNSSYNRIPYNNYNHQNIIGDRLGTYFHEDFNSWTAVCVLHGNCKFSNYLESRKNAIISLTPLLGNNAPLMQEQVFQKEQIDGGSS